MNELSSLVTNNKKIKLNKQLLSTLRQVSWIVNQRKTETISSNEFKQLIDQLITIVKESLLVDGEVERKIHRMSSYLLWETFGMILDVNKNKLALDSIYRLIFDAIRTTSQQRSLYHFYWRNLSIFISNSELSQDLFELSTQGFQRLDYSKKQSKGIFNSTSRSERDFDIQLQLYYSIAFTLRRFERPLPQICYLNIVNALRASSSLSLARHAIYLLLFTVKCQPVDEIKILIDWMLLFLRSDKTSPYRSDMLFMTGLLRSINALSDNSTVDNKMVTEMFLLCSDLINNSHNKIFADLVSSLCRCRVIQIGENFFTDVVNSLVGRLDVAVNRNEIDELAISCLSRVSCDLGRLLFGSDGSTVSGLTAVLVSLLNDRLWRVFTTILKSNLPQLEDALAMAIIWTSPNLNQLQSANAVAAISRICESHTIKRNHEIVDLLDCLIDRVINKHSVLSLESLLRLVDILLTIYRSQPSYKLSHRLRQVLLVVTAAIGSNLTNKSNLDNQIIRLFDKLVDLMDLDVTIVSDSHRSMNIDRYLICNQRTRRDEDEDKHGLNQMLSDVKVSAIWFTVENLDLWNDECLSRLTSRLICLLEGSELLIQGESANALVRILHRINNKSNLEFHLDIILNSLLSHTISRKNESSFYLSGVIESIRVYLSVSKTKTIIDVDRNFSDSSAFITSADEISIKPIQSKVINTYVNSNQIRSPESLVDFNQQQLNSSTIDNATLIFLDQLTLSTSSTPSIKKSSIVDELLDLTYSNPNKKKLTNAPINSLNEIEKNITNKPIESSKLLVLPAPRSATNRHSVATLPKPKRDIMRRSSEGTNNTDLIDMS